MLVDTFTYVTCGLKKLCCHAAHQEVSRCYTKGESEESIAHRLLGVTKQQKIISNLMKQWHLKVELK